MFSSKKVIILIGTLLLIGGILLNPTASLALGDYNHLHKRAVVSFESEHSQGNVEIGFFPLYFHDRIVEVFLEPTYVVAYTDAGNAEVTGYAVSIRKNTDYFVTVSGAVQVRFLLRNGEYEYKTVRFYETVY